MKNLDFTKQEVREKFIAENETNTYFGKNKDGETIIIELEQNVGMTMKTYSKSGKWVNIARYDNEGYCIDSYPEAVGFINPPIDEDTSI